MFTIELDFLVWAPTAWGEEIAIVRGCDLSSASGLRHTGFESWWRGHVTLNALAREFHGVVRPAVECAYHLVKRKVDGGIQWEIGDEHHIQLVPIPALSHVTVITEMRGFDRARTSNWQWALYYGPGVAYRRGRGDHFAEVRRTAAMVFHVTTRAARHQPELRVVGSIPELGRWDYRYGVSLTWCLVERRYVGRVEWSEAGPRPFEFKLMDRLVWEPGSNRKCAIGGDARSGGLVIVDVWGVELL